MESTNPPQPLSLLSLPEDIVLLCLARVSRSYYPKLSLVSKRFKCLLVSKELVKVRSQLKTEENCIYVRLGTPKYQIWFTLWIKPGQQTLPQCTNYWEDEFSGKISEVFPPKDDNKNQQEPLSKSSFVYVLTPGMHEAPPTLMVALKSTGNLLVPAPSPYRQESNSRWIVINRFVIDNVKYNYQNRRLWWYQRSSEQWRLVKGLSRLDKYPSYPSYPLYPSYHSEVVDYGGKLVIFWERPNVSTLDQTKEIWCAMILLDKIFDGEVWGHIEWVDVVLRVPVSYRLSHCRTFLR